MLQDTLQRVGKCRLAHEGTGEGEKIGIAAMVSVVRSPPTRITGTFAEFLTVRAVISLRSGIPLKTGNHPVLHCAPDTLEQFRN
jgi:hypothetical protein